MGDDWQEAAFTNRHLHNRNHKSHNHKGPHSSSSASFEVRRSFGRYAIKCPAAEAHEAPTYTGSSSSASSRRKSSSSKKKGSDESSLDIYRLTESQDGLLGRLVLGGGGGGEAGGGEGVPVVMAGSRKVLRRLLDEFVDVDNGNEGSDQDDEHEENDDDDDDDDDDEEDSDSEESGDEEARQRRRYETFEKNSFRSPKFWLAFPRPPLPASSAHSVLPPPTLLLERVSSAHDGKKDAKADKTKDGKAEKMKEQETNGGYVVFSGNDCKRFRGTLTCTALGWDNVKISGWREVGMSERDDVFVWR